MDIRARVYGYILELIGADGIDSSVNLFEGGYLSSLDVLDLLTFIETTFHIAVEGEEMTADNFGSIDRIVTYLQRAA